MSEKTRKALLWGILILKVLNIVLLSVVITKRIKEKKDFR